MHTPNKVPNWLDLLQKADNGDLIAMSECVSRFVEKNYVNCSNYGERYISYLHTLAKNGRSEAYIMLGDEYESGSLLPPDVNEAIRCYEKAAELGEHFGNECIGMMYFEGKKLQQDYKKAFEYFTKDDKEKSFCTLYSLGEMYRCGYFVDRDPAKAYEYYSRIVYDNSNDRELDAYYKFALFRLGCALHHGIGVKRNLKEAMKCIERAKELYRKTGESSFVFPVDELMQEWDELNQDIGNYKKDKNSMT